MSLADRWRIQLDRLREEGRGRVLRPAAGADFSSNDYLGYSARPWRASAHSRSATASRLLRGHHPIWDEVEAKLATWHRAEAVLMINSGYVANEGLLSTVAEAGDVVFSDQLNHASIIDGLRLCRAEKCVFQHNDLNALEKGMRERKPKRGRNQAWFVVTESLFGMEGDVAPLRELVELAARYEAHLIVDEAHATGCFGDAGSGLVDSLGLRQKVLATVHTGGKALAVTGAYIASSAVLKELLINRCRHLIFTTALPPQIGAWWLDALEMTATDSASRGALHERAHLFRAELAKRRIPVGGGHYIASIVMGMDEAAVETARRLQELGFDIRAIRPPTVPLGTARLRVSIHADHEPEMLRQLVSYLALLCPRSV